MEDSHVILGVHLTNRTQEAGEVQRVLSQYGCNIKTRIGLHHVDNNLCSVQGLILLEIFGGESVCDALAAKLKAIEGIDVQKMVFGH